MDQPDRGHIPFRAGDRQRPTLPNQITWHNFQLKIHFTDLLRNFLSRQSDSLGETVNVPVHSRCLAEALSVLLRKQDEVHSAVGYSVLIQATSTVPLRGLLDAAHLPGLLCREGPARLLHSPSYTAGRQPQPHEIFRLRQVECPSVVMSLLQS